MGVGRDNKNIFCYPQAQDNEMQILENQSGQSSTDEEDIQQPSSNSGRRSSARQRCRARPPRSASLEACLTGMYRRCGARHVRRAENIKYLLSLKVDDEEDSDCQTPGYNNKTSAFGVLLQQRDKMEAWNNFINSSEEDQARILQMRTSAPSLTSIQEESDEEDDVNGNTDDMNDSWEKLCLPNEDKRSVHPSFSAEECFERVDKKLRSMLTRRHLPLGLVGQLEKEMMEFFSESSSSVYISDLSSSFERMLLHSVCQFLGLHCQSFDEDGQRRTQVENRRATFCPPTESLAHFLEHRS